MGSWIGTGASNPGDVGTNGSVGAGTSSPSYKMHALGDNARIVTQGSTNTAYNSVNALNSNSDGIELVAYGRSASGTYLGQNRAGGLFVGASPSAIMGMGTRNNTPLVFGANDAELMRITASGKVGINNTNPLSRLHVSNGDIEVEHNAYGLILKDSSNYRWRVTISTTGTLVTTKL
jgi:hypothetical protein